MNVREMIVGARPWGKTARILTEAYWSIRSGQEQRAVIMAPKTERSVIMIALSEYNLMRHAAQERPWFRKLEADDLKARAQDAAHAAAVPSAALSPSESKAGPKRHG